MSKTEKGKIKIFTSDTSCCGRAKETATNDNAEIAKYQKIAEFANSAGHNEPPHLDLHGLPPSL